VEHIPFTRKLTRVEFQLVVQYWEPHQNQPRRKTNTSPLDRSLPDPVLPLALLYFKRHLFLCEASLMAERIASSNSVNSFRPSAYRAPAATRSTSLFLPRSSSLSPNPKCHLSASRSFISPLSNLSLTGASKVSYFIFSCEGILHRTFYWY
jgi:hypothetical protein